MVGIASTRESIDSFSLPQAYAEAGRYFRGEGVLNWALGQLVADLNKHGIDYAFIGAVALFAHGCERFTENINVILTAEGLEKFRRELLGRGGWGLQGYDQTEVQELIKFRELQPEFAERLDPYVRDKFVELAQAVKQSPKDDLTKE